jgi:hypothetical protein
VAADPAGGRCRTVTIPERFLRTVPGMSVENRVAFAAASPGSRRFGRPSAPADSVRDDLAGVVHQALEPALVSVWVNKHG